MVVVLNAALQEYQAMLMAPIQMQLKDALTVQDLQVTMITHWQYIGKNHSNKRSEDNTLVLSAFGVFCFGCKQKGHNTYECPTKKSTHLLSSSRNTGAHSGRKMGKFQDKCNSCGMLGHKHIDCWPLAKKKHKLPNWSSMRTHGCHKHKY
jgi:hypothetical protein